MRQLTYQTLDAHENAESAEGTLLEFLFAIPNLLHGGIMPPLRVLNHVLAEGALLTPEGGCRWEPFRLTQTEYLDVVSAFNELGESAVHAWDAPDWVETYSDWSILLADRLFGIPADEHLARHRAFEALVVERDAAIARGDQAEANRLSAEADAAANLLAAFLNEHMHRIEAARS